MVAVTTAHAFSLADLAGAAEVSFLLGRSEQRASVASRLWVAPGQPFSAPGGTLRGDFLIFALDLAPRGVRTLALCSSECVKVGQRVRILGPPGDGDSVRGWHSSARESCVMFSTPSTP